MSTTTDAQIEEAIQQRSKDISTDFLAMSVGELVSLYENSEMDIHPEFQRFFRWDEDQKSNLVESMLLGIPIPPIFVAQAKDGIWELVDGLQRISTLFELMGILRDEAGQVLPTLKLNQTMYLPQMAGMTWDGRDGTKELPQSVKLRIRRARIDVKIVLNKSDDSVKYELFRRLNTGGSIATDQEVRNCLLIMTSKEFYKWFDTLGKDQNFKDVLPLSERMWDEAYDLELLTRFISLHDVPLARVSRDIEIGSFLTQEMMSIAKKDAAWLDKTKAVFESTFSLLNEALGEDAFKKFDSAKGISLGPVLISVFEVMALGIGHAIRGGKSVTPQKVQSVHHSLWTNAEFTSAGGSGIASRTRLPKTLSIGRKLFA